MVHLHILCPSLYRLNLLMIYAVASVVYRKFLLSWMIKSYYFMLIQIFTKSIITHEAIHIEMARTVLIFA